MERGERLRLTVIRGAKALALDPASKKDLSLLALITRNLGAVPPALLAVWKSLG